MKEMLIELLCEWEYMRKEFRGGCDWSTEELFEQLQDLIKYDRESLNMLRVWVKKFGKDV